MTFPLTVSASGRYLVDRSGTPFLYHADTAWRMPQRLERDDVNVYLDNRAKRGYNAVHIHAINKEQEGPVNIYNHPPFEPLDDLTSPYELYWQHLDFVLECIARRDMLAVISAAWFGAGGRGWRPQLTPKVAYQYGRFLGTRYSHLQNILWVQGGDNDPGDRTDAAAALARAIRETAPHHLHTYHAQAEHASSVFFEDADWLDINFAYTYRPAHLQVSAEFLRRGATRPIILAETGYEGEANTGFPWTVKLVRQQSYWALLSGAAGHAHGSATVWHFGDGWQAALEKSSDVQMEHVAALFATRPWHTLVPDHDHTLLILGYGAGATAAAAAYTADRSLGLIYLQGQGTITVNLDHLRGPIRAFWFDPTNGSATTINDVIPAHGGAHNFTLPGSNHAGDDDWVLVLETPESSVH